MQRAADEVVTGLQLAVRGFEHRIGLADAGAHAEKNLAPTALLRGLLALEGTQQRVGIGAVLVSHAISVTQARRNSVQICALRAVDWEETTSKTAMKRQSLDRENLPFPVSEL